MGAQQAGGRRRWTVEPRIIDEETGTAYLDPAEVADEMAGMAYVLTRIGGAVTVLAERQQVNAPGEPEEFETVRVRFGWESFVPGRRLPREQQPQQDEERVEVDDETPEPAPA